MYLHRPGTNFFVLLTPWPKVKVQTLGKLPSASKIVSWCCALSGAVSMVTEVEEYTHPLKPFIKLSISFSRPELSIKQLFGCLTLTEYYDLASKLLPVNLTILPITVAYLLVCSDFGFSHPPPVAFLHFFWVCN